MRWLCIGEVVYLRWFLLRSGFGLYVPLGSETIVSICVLFGDVCLDRNLCVLSFRLWDVGCVCLFVDAVDTVVG